MKKSVMALIILCLVIMTSACSAAKQNQASMGDMSQMDKSGMSDMKGMKMPMNAPDPNVHASWTFTPSIPVPGQAAELTIALTEKSGKPISDFDVVNEKKMHLIVVSKDLSYFNHIHPEYKGNGIFTVTTTLPAGGDYKLLADFTPKGGMESYQEFWVQAAGDVPAPQPLTINDSQHLVAVANGKEISLTIAGKLQAGKSLMLNYHFADAEIHEPFRQLQPYLGTAGHMVIMSEDAGQYTHSHPVNPTSTGPDVTFNVTFPTSGVYKIWGQFQADGNVFVVPFVINVP